MPYDPANFSFTSRSLNQFHDPTTEYAANKSQRLEARYIYAPEVRALQPLKKVNALTFKPLPNQLQLHSNLMRQYQERQLRDLTQQAIDGRTNAGQLTFGSHFAWDRGFAFTWDITPRLKPPSAQAPRK